MKRVAVTGGSGKAGRAVCRDLAEHGYEVRTVDRHRPTTEVTGHFLKCDLTDLGQTYEALAGSDAVVHLAAIPAPGLQTDEVTFRVNMASTYNVFRAATDLALAKVVWASSETTVGVPFEHEKPLYAPIDEDHPLQPESSYALSKVLGEEMAVRFRRWGGPPSVALRFSNIMEPEDYAGFPSYRTDAGLRKWNLWSYVDARDVAQACRLGLGAEIEGAEPFLIAAADTVMERTNKDLMNEVYPDVPLREGTGDHDTLLGIGKAAEILGYRPQHSWRDHT